MSHRSRLSTHSNQSFRSNQIKSSIEDLYHYSLRVAYLAHLISNRSQNHQDNLHSSNGHQSNPSNSHHKHSSHLSRPHLRHQAETWTNTIFSIADVFKDTNNGSKDGKSVKFPKELIKVLKLKIESVVKGNDKTHQDMLLRSTFGIFYGTYTQDYYLKQLKENRNIEALILLFVTTATGVLKKRLEGDEWKMHLNSQVGVFVTIIRDCLRSKEVKNVPQELSARLDSYASKLIPSSPSINPSIDHRKSLNIQSTSSNVSTSIDTTSMSPWSSSHFIHDMPIVKTVGLLFNISDSQLQKDLNLIRKSCTEKGGFDDFKLCIANIAQQCPFPGCRADFDSEEAYHDWRTKELANLQQAMLHMIQTNPELVQSRSHSNSTSNDDFVLVSNKDSSPASNFNRHHSSRVDSSSGISHGSGGFGSQRNSLRPESISVSPNLSKFDLSLHDTLKEIDDLQEDFNEDHQDKNNQISPSIDQDLVTHQFTYIPPNPIKTYASLMEQCLDFDLESMKNLAEDEEVSLKILSQNHLELLEQCALRWRLMLPFQVSVFFNAICQRFEEEEIPIIDCVSEALYDVFKVLEEIKFEMWAHRDKMMMKQTMSRLFDTLLRRIYEAIQLVIESKPPEDIPNALSCLISIHDSEPFKLVTDLDQRFKEFEEAVTELYDNLYSLKRDGLLSSERPNNVVLFLELIAWINSCSNRINKKFKQPLLDSIDLVSIYLSRLCAHLVQDLDSLKAMLLPPPPIIPGKDGTVNVGLVNQKAESNYNDADVLALYHALTEIKKKHDMCNSNAPLVMPVDEWFLPYVQNWLDAAETKTSEWVQSAIKADKFAPEGNDCHSTSISDLMDSCRSAVDFIQKLKWPNEYHNAKFMTRLSKIISKSIEQYSQTIEEAFVQEMFPKAINDADREANRSAIWTRARLAVQGDKKPESFQFQEASCVKLNNVESARVLLDKMYTMIDVDNVARIIHEWEPELTQTDVRPSSSYLFTVKVVTAEGLVGPDGSVNKIDPFLTLSDQKGNRIAKTRTLYETTSPNWNETFDISVKGSLWVAATIYKRNLMEKHDLLGRAFLHLNPQEFNDFLAHDLLLDLDTRGRVLVRVSMEGEKDDVQFHFGRAFRSLKRAETDMIRMIVDKISPVIRYYISHATLRKLIPSPGFIKSIDMSKMSTKIDIDISKVTSYGAGLWRSVANSTREPEIPLPKEELMAANAANSQSDQSTPSRSKGPKDLTDSDIENAIADLFEYFDQCMSVLRHSLSEKAGQLVMNKIWKEILSIIDSLLLPPLSDQPSDMRPLSGKEVDVVLKWLKFLTNFFHADGEGVPIEDLHNQKYKEIWSIGFFYDRHTDDLMEECVRAMQQQLRRGTTKSVSRNKSVYQQRNLGTIRKRKADKKQDQEPTSTEMIMRILRLRPGTTEFLQQQIATMASFNAAQQQQTRKKSTHHLSSHHKHYDHDHSKSNSSRKPLGSKSNRLKS
ncbi:hypothetical protein O181_000450 [Austropuccinia psidii MF-1]|uniref:C2 domain-containing protein n=1 Tax=Austropuccinia psidii MF-1 TaxID=1389203 RepID=A0A9Q3GAW2_9BASI|nr:hypothetical protein [Austropuccinia psidii MF-1]